MEVVGFQARAHFTHVLANHEIRHFYYNNYVIIIAIGGDVNLRIRFEKARSEDR